LIDAFYHPDFSMDIKLKDLRYLVAVADTRHFGRAAERTFVSQPTLSAQLKKLEHHLGVQLIERAPKRVALTAVGEAIVARARRIMAASDEIVDLAKSFRDPLAGPLKLALLPTIGPYLLPNVAPKISKALPRIELMLYEYQTAPMLEKLHAGELDAGILALPVELDGLEARELYREPFVVAMPSAHKLAERNSLRVDDLKGETLLLLEDGHCLRDQALEVCGRAALNEKQDFRATSLETLRQMVAAGSGITLLPTLAAQGAYGNARGVVTKPFAKPTPTRTIGAIWRKTSARTVAIDALCREIAAHTL
jgi:LysR family hydrogen peroxide-inducible transcriptional activator